MEWRKIRSWLIVMVLAVDLFLAGNLLLQGLAVRQNERQAAQDAVAVAQGRGIEISLEAVLRLPEEMTLWQAQRSDQLEGAAAQALLGTVRRESPGGGVAIYTGASGQMLFRRGGALELDGPWTGTAFDAATCVEVLENAGFALDEAQTLQTDGQVQLTQQYAGYPIFNSRLTCQNGEGRLQAEGRWMLTGEPVAADTSLSRAQLVLTLCDLLESRQTALREVQAGYCLLSEDGQSLTLEPVWAVDTADGRILVSCISGETLNG